MTEAPESLKKKTFRGTIWSSVERFSIQGVQFIVMLFMARILTPEDYGLVGMLTVFIAVCQVLIDSGFTNALVRKVNRTQADFCTVYYFNIAAGIILYGIMWFCAPLIARFYDEPQLINLTRVITLSFVIGPLTGIQWANFTINVDFRSTAKASITAAALGGIVGLYMAYAGYGVWAIVGNQLAGAIVSGIIIWYIGTWRPKLIFSWKSFHELFGYGSKLAASGIIDTVYNNAFKLVIGKVYNAADLGYYTRAANFSQFPSSNLTAIISRVTFPILCSIQEDDDRLRSVYRRFLRLSAFIVFPLMIGLATLAYPLVITLVGEKWAFSATLLSIICFSMMWFPIHAINLNLLQVKGRSDLFLKLEIWKKCIGVAILAISACISIVAMCFGSLIGSIIALLINTHYTGKIIQVGFLTQMRDLAPTLIYSFSMGIVVYLSTLLFDSNVLKLIIGTMCGVAYYIGITKITGSQDLRELIAFWKARK